MLAEVIPVYDFRDTICTPVNPGKEKVQQDEKHESALGN
jgi:hypothetical protein